MNRRDTLLLAGRIGLLVAVGALAILTTESGDWKPWSLFAALLALAVGRPVPLRQGRQRTARPRVRPTALAMALLGPGPAAVIAVAALIVWSLKAATPWALLFDNVSRSPRTPSSAACCSWRSGDPGHRDDPQLSTAADRLRRLLRRQPAQLPPRRRRTCCLRDGARLGAAMRRVYLPVAAVGGGRRALTAGTVVAYQEIGLAAIAAARRSCSSPARTCSAGRSMPARARRAARSSVGELEALHHGVIRVMVETLGMRDRMTARHSAAVARFAKATAAGAGLGAREQELVHTAGPGPRRRQVHLPRPHAHRQPADRGRLGADPLPSAARRRHRRERARLRARWPTSSCASTSGSTGTAIRATWPARTSRCSPASSRSRTAST